MAASVKTATPKEIALEFGTTGKTLRKFLRSITPKEDQPGKGGRWSIPAAKRDMTALRTRFDAWSLQQEELRKEREALKAAEVDASDVEDIDDEADELGEDAE